LVGFRTTGGIDMNEANFSCHNLFDNSQSNVYSSCTSPNLVVSGVVVVEDAMEVIHKIKEVFKLRISSEKDIVQMSEELSQIL
jgi:hypothetical protein